MGRTPLHAIANDATTTTTTTTMPAVTLMSTTPSEQPPAKATPSPDTNGPVTASTPTQNPPTKSRNSVDAKTEEKIKIEIPIIEETELLGSVTTLSSPAVRTSARVIQKLKLDQNRPASPPPTSATNGAIASASNDRLTDGSGGGTAGQSRTDRGSHHSPHPKTPSHSKSAKVTWSSVERNLFFDAVCEYGKDFDAIANYVNMKVRRHHISAANAAAVGAKSAAAAAAAAALHHAATDTSGAPTSALSSTTASSSAGANSSLGGASASAATISMLVASGTLSGTLPVINIKTKDHVRLLYYQTFHKVTKYLRFADDVKKVAQELYALINYGEMRKKLVFINHKAWAKLTELVYQGSVMVRAKGKNIRIKTPACKALRRLNQMEEWQEEIKLPSKVEVFLRPANGEAWNRVQAMAMNPRVRTTVPLQKRLVSLLRSMQLRWRSREARMSDHTLSVLADRKHAAESAAAAAAAAAAAGFVTSQASSSATSTAPVTTSTSLTSNATNHKASNSANFTANAATAAGQLLLDDETARHYVRVEPRLRFAPPPNTVIHRPMVNLSEFLSSYSLCLNAYEERIGVAVKGEQLSTERLTSIMAKEGQMRSNAKRQRNDSGCATMATSTATTTASKETVRDVGSSAMGTAGSGERKSPEYKRARSDPELMQAPAVATMTPATSTEMIEGPFGAVSDSASTSDDTQTQTTTTTTIDVQPSTLESSTDDSDCKDDVLKTKFHLFGSELESLCTKAKTDSTTSTESSVLPPSTTIPSAPTSTTSATAVATEKATIAAGNRAKRRDAKTLATRRRRENFRPLISEPMLAHIMRGWCATDIGDVTVGDLYIMFGQDFKLNLEYSWQPAPTPAAKVETIPVADAIKKEDVAAAGGADHQTKATAAATLEVDLKPNVVELAVNTAASTSAPTMPTTVEPPAPPPPADDPAEADRRQRLAVGQALSSKLKRLLLLASLAEKAKEVKEPKGKKTATSATGTTSSSNNAASPATPTPTPPIASCTCGHVCDRNSAGGGGGVGHGNGNFAGHPIAIRSKSGHTFDGSPRSYISNRIFPSSLNDSGVFRHPLPTQAYASSSSGGGLFANGGGNRFGPTPMESYRMSVSQQRNKQNRWLRVRHMRTASKQVVVQRMLPLQPGAAQTYDVLRNPMDGIAGGSSGSSSGGYYNQHMTPPALSSSLGGTAFGFAARQAAPAFGHQRNATTPAVGQQSRRVYSAHTEHPVSLVANSVPSCHPLAAAARTSAAAAAAVVAGDEVAEDMPPKKRSKVDNDDVDDDGGNDNNDGDDDDAAEDDDDDDDDDDDGDEVEDDDENDVNDHDDDSIANDPGIQSLMDISLPSPTPTLSNLDDLFSYSNATPMSPMTLLRQSPTDPRWYDENVNDFSLSSFFGHLGEGNAPTKSPSSVTTATASHNSQVAIATDATDVNATIETPHKQPLSTDTMVTAPSPETSPSTCKASHPGPIERLHNRPPSSLLAQLETSRMSSMTETSIDFVPNFDEIAKSIISQQQQQQ